MWAPPSPIIETDSPVRPSVRRGMSETASRAATRADIIPAMPSSRRSRRVSMASSSCVPAGEPCCGRRKRRASSVRSTSPGMASSRPLRLIPLIHRVTHRIGLHIAGWSDVAVTQPEAHILDSLAVEGPCTVGTLHQAFAHRRSTLTSVLDRLEARRLITRRTNRDDRRSSIVALTERGARVARKAHARLEELERRALDGASANNLDAVIRLLQKVGAAASALGTPRDQARPTRRAPPG